MSEEQKLPRKNIAVLGAGFGGITCALRLEKLMRKHALFSSYNLVLVDKKNYHLYTPALYEVATTFSGDGSIINIKRAVVTPIEEMTQGKKIVFLQGAVGGVDVVAKTIHFNDHTALPYEYVVFALGSEPTYFGIPGMKEHSISLKWLEDSIHIRNVIRNKYDAKQQNETLRILVGGGGPNSVEFSGEAVGYLKELNKKLNKTVNLELIIIEGAHHILPGFGLEVTGHANRRLAQLGVSLKTGFVVTSVDGASVHIKSVPPLNVPHEQFTPSEETLPYDVLIWSGGVQANAIAQGGTLQKEKRGRIETNQFMRCISPDQHLDVAQHVFAIGDNACFYDTRTNLPVPGTARIAIEQAKIVAKNICRDILGKPKLKYFAKNYPVAIPIGGKYAIAKIGPLVLTGFPGWAFKQVVEIYYLNSVTDSWHAITRWWKGVEIFSKND